MRGIFLILVVGLCSCDVSVNKQNDKKDIESARAISLKFYDLVKEKQYENAARYFSKEVGYEDGIQILKKVNTYLGDLDSVVFVSGKSNVTSGPTSKEAEFDLNFKVFYRLKAADEQMVMSIIHDTLRITGYHPRIKL